MLKAAGQKLKNSFSVSDLNKRNGVTCRAKNFADCERGEHIDVRLITIEHRPGWQSKERTAALPAANHLARVDLLPGVGYLSAFLEILLSNVR